MEFPVYFNLFGHRVHPHLILELIAYSAGFQLYLVTHRRWPRAAVPLEQNMWLVVGCVFGALIGSKTLAFFESFDHYRQHIGDPRAWLGGKTIVGGLLGGWVGVEIVKHRFHIRHSTGDAFVFPLIIGMCIGRVGCFLTGLDDHTHGTHTNLPWGVDFGDGPRHPTQLYEIVLLALTGIVLAIRERMARGKHFTRNGQLFRLFLLVYLAFRFFVEFIKPRYSPLAGLSAIQVAALAGAAVCLWQLARPRHNIWESTNDGTAAATAATAATAPAAPHV